MELPNITDFLFHGGGILIIKIPILILIFLYLLFIFIVISRIKALNRTLQVSASRASQMLQALTVIQFALTLSLFLFALVIV
jgi:hypothetical protein